MKDGALYYGGAHMNRECPEVSLKTVERNGDVYFKIEHYDDMPPFFMTIVSDVDFWMFVSSTGGLTAGRNNPDSALFPYETDDKIHDGCETAGAHSVFIVTANDKQYLWTPFTRHHADVYSISRNLYKSALGNKIMFEEVNETLGVTFRYTWKTSQGYGIVKASELTNDTGLDVTVRVLDGIRNILPYGVDTALQSTRSTLVDGYKRSELIERHGLGLFTLSSIISDKAEPSESLKATTVWFSGFEPRTYLLSDMQVKVFEKNLPLITEYDVKGRRGAFYVSGEIALKAGQTTSWVIVSEVNQSAVKVEALMQELEDKGKLVSKLNRDILEGDKSLKKLVYEADGFQRTDNAYVTHRHYANTLYNIMRGGIYADGYQIDVDDFKAFVGKWNKVVRTKHDAFFAALEKKVSYDDLTKRVANLGDDSLVRLVKEYLPLTYSRRHGDPSRPWNKFNIDVLKENGEKKLHFEGNWRDIFQNWEALSLSFPGYIESIVSKFVNASTLDGYNPYRITKDGVDWELLDPADPWSNIGYWGDHQVIYLLKLLELSQQYNPSALSELLDKSIFVYAHVPYRIKGFDELVKDPRNTIIFDEALESLIETRVQELGADGKLVFLENEPYRVNLMEKLLVVLLSKLSNYIPEGGIWMNTQRPEWNDANNALVGNGVSMVTLYYLHRYLAFFLELSKQHPGTSMVSKEVYQLFEAIYKVFHETKPCQEASHMEKARYLMASRLGRAGDNYRQTLYDHGFSGEKVHLSQNDLETFIGDVLVHIKHTIAQNKREDGLYHAYNLVKFSNESVSISHLYEMLEGQVAVLSSKALKAKEALAVLEALRQSAIYREDQNSYMLYPARELPRFLDKNILPESWVKGSIVLESEIQKGLTRFVERDVRGQYRFNGIFRNATELMDALLQTQEYDLPDVLKVGELFEDLFDHHAFTGRSGTFYKYEGLGCIYWHMVSKLVLAAQETYQMALLSNEDSETIDALSFFYDELKDGIGAEKAPNVYGAFPTDAYSHTPAFSGVQQPGMTGQVKEDIISRFGELGVSVSQGQLTFNPRLIQRAEFLKAPTQWELPDGTITLDKHQIGFTVCAVPIIYEANNYQAITVVYHNGDQYTFENTTKLSKEISESIFKREGKIYKIIVRIK